MDIDNMDGKEAVISAMDETQEEINMEEDYDNDNDDEDRDVIDDNDHVGEEMEEGNLKKKKKLIRKDLMVNSREAREKKSSLSSDYLSATNNKTFSKLCRIKTKPLQRGGKKPASLAKKTTPASAYIPQPLAKAAAGVARNIRLQNKKRMSDGDAVVPVKDTSASSKIISANLKILGTTNLSGHHIMVEKNRKEIESKLIQRAHEIAKLSTPKATKPLPEGQSTVMNLADAVHKSSSECNALILNWHVGQAKRIGMRCKVYWDGDMTWYYARIINYDSIYDKHFIYYELDNTVEWIQLAEETVLVAEEIMMTKYGTQLYPCLTYWASSKARELIKILPGYKKGGDYIEYFNEEGLGEYEFTNIKSLTPIHSHASDKMSHEHDNDVSPNKGRSHTNKRHRLCMESAKAEQAVVMTVVELVVPTIKRLAFQQLYGEQWLGIRIRASTHRIPDISSSSSSSSSSSVAKCVGTIARYCPNTDRYLIIFDQDLLQPKWIQLLPPPSSLSLSSSSMIKSEHDDHNDDMSSSASYEVEILLSPDETSEDSAVAYLRCQSPANIDDCGICGLGASDHHRYPQLSSSSSMHRCLSCKQSYHGYCHPDNNDDTSSSSSSSTSSYWKNWMCWRCISCDSCKRSLYDMPMMSWNLHHISSITNKQVRVCGACLDHYINTQNFCSICGVIYDNHHQPSSSAMISSSDKTSSSNMIEDGITSSSSSSSDHKASSHDGDDNMMVACNECNRWIHARCDGIDQEQYDAITSGHHPVWGDEYLCPMCRVSLASMMVSQLQALDVHHTFAQPVTEHLAKGYFDIIRNPMDLATMMKRANGGYYKSLQSLRQDAELMIMNAFIYNKTGDEYWIEAYDYYELIKTAVFDSNQRITSVSAYGHEITSIIDRSKAELKAIKDQKDKDHRMTRKRRDDVMIGDVYAGLSSYVDMKGNPMTSSSSLTSSSSSSSRRIKAKLDDDHMIDNDDDHMSSSMIADDDNNNQVTLCQTISSPSSSSHILTNDDDHILSPSSSSSYDDDSTLIMPTTLSSSSCIISYISCAAITLPPEAAYMEAYHDACLVCTSSDAHHMFLYCIDCGEAYHSFCVDAPLASMNHHQRLSWRCANCKICEICYEHHDDDKDGNSMIYCDGCDKTYHMKCLSPMMIADEDHASSLSSVVPSSSSSSTSSFYCQSCVKCTMMGCDDHSWGYKADQCYRCANPKATTTSSSSLIKPSPFNISASSSSSSSSVNDSHINTCGVCNHPIKAESPSLSCSRCMRHIHIRCCGDKHTSTSYSDNRSYLFLSKPTMMQDWICCKCTSSYITSHHHKYQHHDGHKHDNDDDKHDDDDKMFCHVGDEASYHMMKILSKVGLIQRKRVHHARMIRHAAVNAYDKLLCSQYHNMMDTLCLQSIIRWTHRRARHHLLSSSSSSLSSSSSYMHMSKMINASVSSAAAAASSSSGVMKYPTSGYHASNIDPPASWGRSRAHRYVAMMRLRAAKSSSSSSSYDGKNMMLSYLDMMIQAPFQHDMPMTMISSIWREASLASSFLRFTDPITTQSSSSSMKDDEYQLVVNELKMMYHQHHHHDDANMESKLTDMHKQLLSQPVGLRDIFLPDKFVDGSTVADNASSSSTSSDADALPVPHWAPAGRRPTLLSSHKKPGIISSSSMMASSSSMISSSSSSSSSYLAERLQRQTQPDIIPQPIPPLHRLASLHITPDVSSSYHDGYFNKKLRQHLEPSSSSSSLPSSSSSSSVSLYDAYMNAVQPIKQISSSLKHIIVDLHNARATFEHDEIQRQRNLMPSSFPLSTSSSSSSSSSSSLVPKVPVDIKDDMAAREATLGLLNLSSSSSVNTSSVDVMNHHPSSTNCIINNHIVSSSTDDVHNNLSSSSSSPDSKKRKLSSVDSYQHAMSHDNIILTPATHIHPMTGWHHPLSLSSSVIPSSSSLSSSSFPWFNCRICCLCKTSSSIITGRLLSFSDGLSAHANCLRYSDDVYEKSNTLINAYKARERGVRTRCWYCDDRGATISCLSSSCKRSYHLHCAIASCCTFIEAKHADDISSSSHAIYTVMACPEHHHLLSSSSSAAATSMISSASSYNKAHHSHHIHHHVSSILEPLRPLFVDSHYHTDSIELASYLEKIHMKKDDIAAVRTGAIIIHRLGSIIIDQPAFSSTHMISPVGYHATRIYWSMSHPWTRATYVIDIYKSTDIITSSSTSYPSSSSSSSSSSYDEDSQLMSINRTAYDMIEESRAYYIFNDEHKAILASVGMKIPSSSYGDEEIHPVYRIKCFDDHPSSLSSSSTASAPPIYTSSLDEALCIIISRVLLWQKHHLPSHKMRSHLSSSPCYGLLASIFFGLGLPFVRHAIERFPETVAYMMLPSSSPYRYEPSYYLPAVEAGQRMHLYLSSLKQYHSGRNRKSINGCYRADPKISYHASYPPRRAMNKSLSKAVDRNDDHLTSSSSSSSSSNEDDNTGRMDSQRILSLRYHALSSAYLHDPYASLTVRKSSIHGHGLFARVSFSKDDMLVEYIGQKIRQTVADRREIQYEEEGVGSCYLFRQDRDAIIDATRIGGMARFINHCCEPNAYARIISASSSTSSSSYVNDDDIEEKHIIIMAARDIGPGEEITYDYKFPVEDTKLKCYCGASKCVGYMN